jgi:NAD(P)-dependent dehydrogenase (short-subunit alcohol dehydrogenase family)|tara:strand:- start:125 stop:859 length:735 start_codon:yes stop_codon:yes gene_type:complete
MKKVLIVTGGSRGIGHATSVLAAEAGWDVCVNYVSNKTRADETVARIKAVGKRAIAVQANINNEHDVIRLFETCTSELGEVTGVVNSAGIVEPYCRVDELKYEEIVPLININVVAMMVVTREAIKRMSTKNNGLGGSIVLLSSVSARIGSPGFCVAYAASKGAVDSFAWGAAQEVVGEGVRINAVSPGIIDTEIQPKGRVEQAGPNLPIGRVGQPEEVARAIVWLLSDDASYVAGSNLDVAAGR